jgi:predicted DNA-binding transcriptional regulator AlpA
MNDANEQRPQVPSNGERRPAEASPRTRMSLPPDRLWTVHQAAAFLSRSVSWVYKAAESGVLPRAMGLGWGLRFVPADLYAFASGQTRNHPGAIVISRGAR